MCAAGLATSTSARRKATWRIWMTVATAAASPSRQRGKRRNNKKAISRERRSVLQPTALAIPLHLTGTPSSKEQATNDGKRERAQECHHQCSPEAIDTASELRRGKAQDETSDKRADHAQQDVTQTTKAAPARQVTREPACQQSRDNPTEPSTRIKCNHISLLVFPAGSYALYVHQAKRLRNVSYYQ